MTSTAMILFGEIEHGPVPLGHTIFFALVLVGTLVLLATERVQKTVLVLMSAGMCMFMADTLWKFFPPRHEEGHHLPVYIDMIEWEVIGIVIGATVFVEIAARSGVFAWISIKMLKASKGDPFRLLTFFSILTVVFSAFLDNITAMIIIGSLTVVACRKLELDPKPYLITEGIMTNVGGLLTLISSIPNIIVGKAAGITYLDFVMVSTPYTVVAIWLSLLVAGRQFKAKIPTLKTAEERELNLARVNAFDEWETVKNKRFFYSSIVAVVVLILAFAFHSQIPIIQDFGIEVVAMGAAVVMMLLHAEDVEHDLSNVEWTLVFFFIGLFIIIGIMEIAGVLDKIGVILQGVTNWTGGYGLMWLTAIFSSVTDNIPLAAMLAKIFGAQEAVPATYWWAVVFGANLGGNITPIGSASTVVACTILKKNKLTLAFMDFVKIGVVFAGVQLAWATVYLFLLGFFV